MIHNHIKTYTLRIILLLFLLLPISSIVYALEKETNIAEVEHNSIRLISVPTEQTLDPIDVYRFEVENPDNQPMGIMLDKTWYPYEEWIKLDSTYYIDIMPGESTTLSLISYEHKNKKRILAEYKISTPNRDDKDFINREQLWGPKRNKCNEFDSIIFVNIPKYGILNPARTYRFEIKNPYNKQFGIIINNDTLLRSELWKKDGDIYYKDVMPAVEGILSIGIHKYNTKDEYIKLFEYKVTPPTDSEALYIQSHLPPKEYIVDSGALEVVDIPKYRFLNPATKYHFEVKNPHGMKFLIKVNNNREGEHPEWEWKRDGDRYWIDVMPAEEGVLKLMVRQPGDNNLAETQYEYIVTSPTEEDIDYINNHRPPQYYEHEGIDIVNIPPDRNLNPATTYHFEVSNPTDIPFDIFINDTVQYHCSQWKKSDNIYSIDLMPADSGTLKLAMNNRPFVVYHIAHPTEQEEEYIYTHRPPIIRYCEDIAKLQFIDIPKYNLLNPAKKYHFELRNPDDLPLSVLINNIEYNYPNWIKNDNVYSIDLMPAKEGTLKIALRLGKGKFLSFAEYQISKPTPEEVEIIANNEPPTVKNLGAYNLNLLEIPTPKKLNPAKNCHFKIGNPNNIPFRIRVNNTIKYSSSHWKQDDTVSIDLMPGEAGKLVLEVINGNTLYTQVEYLVNNPTEEDIQHINTHRAPTIKSLAINDFKLVNIPLQSPLNPATPYPFEIYNPQDLPFQMRVQKDNDIKHFDYKHPKWEKDSSGIYSISLMPAAYETLRIYVKRHLFVEYQIAQPTPEEQQHINQHEDPYIYDLSYESIDLIKIPKEKLLNPAQSYDFVVANPLEIPFAIFVNDNTMYDYSDWEKEGDEYSIDIMPKEGGTLKISVMNPETQQYQIRALYNISEPTAAENKTIQKAIQAEAKKKKSKP